MKALTICQPYAHLICLPDDDPQAKRVENRTWPTSLRGEILIHAGKSRAWLNLDDDSHDIEYGIPIDKMTFGAIVGIANLADCVQVVPDSNGSPLFHRGSQFRNDASVRMRWPWLHAHQHVEGPCCFVLTECRRLQVPIPFKGAQGFFNVPAEIVEQAKAQLFATT